MTYVFASFICIKLDRVPIILIAGEHLVHAHPSLITHLKLLFNLLITHGFAPDAFGDGTIVPLHDQRQKQ